MPNAKRGSRMLDGVQCNERHAKSISPMKRPNILQTALLALAGAALVASSRQADSAMITPNETCDMILGFRVGTLYDDSFNALPAQGIGESSNLEIDLGSAAQFYNATTGANFTLPAVSVADLIATFGSNWNTRTDLFWGVVGTTGRGYGSLIYNGSSTYAINATADSHAPVKTIWATRAEDTLGTQSTPWLRGSIFAQAAPIAQIESMYVGTSPLIGATSTDNSPVAAVIDSSTPGSWTYQDLHNSTSTSFGYFNGTIDNTTSISIGTYSVSDLYELRPGSGPGALLGAFGLDSSGTFVFSTDPTYFATPEPSSLALLGLAGGIFATRRRRPRPSATV